MAAKDLQRYQFSASAFAIERMQHTCNPTFVLNDDRRSSGPYCEPSVWKRIKTSHTEVLTGAVDLLRTAQATNQIMHGC